MRHYYFEILSPIEFKYVNDYQIIIKSWIFLFFISEDPLFLRSRGGAGER